MRILYIHPDPSSPRTTEIVEAIGEIDGVSSMSAIAPGQPVTGRRVDYILVDPEAMNGDGFNRWFSSAIRTHIGPKTRAFTVTDTFASAHGINPS